MVLDFNQEAPIPKNLTGSNVKLSCHYDRMPKWLNKNLLFYLLRPRGGSKCYRQVVCYKDESAPKLALYNGQHQINSIRYWLIYLLIKTYKSYQSLSTGTFICIGRYLFIPFSISSLFMKLNKLRTQKVAQFEDEFMFFCKIQTNDIF